MLANRHSALHTYPDSLNRLIALPRKQSLQNCHCSLPDSGLQCPKTTESSQPELRHRAACHANVTFIFSIRMREQIGSMGLMQKLARGDSVSLGTARREGAVRSPSWSAQAGAGGRRQNPCPDLRPNPLSSWAEDGMGLSSKLLGMICRASILFCIVWTSCPVDNKDDFPSRS